MRILVVLVLLLLTGCTSQESETKLMQIEQSLNSASASGGITPELYDDIKSQLIDLEKSGANRDKVHDLKEMLDGLEVGGRQQEGPGISTDNSLMELENDIDYYLSQEQGIGFDIYNQLDERINAIEASEADIQRVKNKLDILKPTYQQEKKITETIRQGLLSPRGCEGNGSFKFGASPLDLNDLEKIRPMGAMSVVHITPTDHQYWDTIGNNVVDDKETLDRFKVYSPGDGNIVEIGFMDNDYRVIIEHTCTFYTIFIHVDKLTDEIMAQAGLKRKPGEQVWPRIAVEEGQVIGSIGTGKLDFSVIDEEVVLPGFIKPETYEGEVWKIHTADTFDYYEEPLRSELLKKNVRTVKPFGGKIDYDISGKLIGNWFVEGTGGYRGLGNYNYWVTHLSIVYDSIDPEHIVVSIGDFGGKETIFGVKENEPDPAQVSEGIVKYELVPYSYYKKSTGEKWDRAEFADDLEARNENEVRGVALFEVLENDRLKAEFFPGATDVSGFTSSAKIYER